MGEAAERLFRIFHFRKFYAMLALVEFEEGFGDLPLKIARMDNVELRGRAVGEALQAE